MRIEVSPHTDPNESWEFIMGRLNGADLEFHFKDGTTDTGRYAGMFGPGEFAYHVYLDEWDDDNFEEKSIEIEMVERVVYI